MSQNSFESEDSDPGGDAKAKERALTRRAFLYMGIAGSIGIAAARTMNSMPRSNGLRKPLRAGLDLNAKWWRSVRSPTSSIPVYPPSAVQSPIARSAIGLAKSSDHGQWRLQVSGVEGDKKFELTLDDIKKFPRVELIAELFCVEGWSFKAQWTGTPMSEFALMFPPMTGAEHVALQTPGADYFVGLEMASALHHQTLLCYEMNGKPLTIKHGAPLRMIVPTKYGLKSLKNVAHLTYSREQPRDSWFERGYDYDCGL